MKFLCLICAAKVMEQMTKAEGRRHLAQYRVLTERLRKRGQLVGCNRLLPAGTATTVRVRIRGALDRREGVGSLPPTTME